LQSSLYLFLDKIYFAEQHNIKITNIANFFNKTTIKPNVNFPDGATDIMLSYDGTYTTYFNVNGILKVLDTNTRKFLILQSGDIYISNGSSVIRTKDGKTINYKGTLIGIFNNYVASIVNKKLVLKTIGSSS